MQNILERKPEEICKDVLKQLKNNDVNVELDNSSKTSLYVFLGNTIYISNKKVKTKKSIEEQNKAKLLVISHECAHSIQPKILQFANFILSNVEILLFLVILFLTCILKYANPILTYTYVAMLMASIFVRLYLEMDATIKSVKITVRYLLNNEVEKGQVVHLVKYYKKQLLKTLPLFILSIYITKIARLMIILVI